MRYDKWKKRVEKERAAKEAELQAEIERLKQKHEQPKKHWVKRFLTSIWGILLQLALVSGIAVYFQLFENVAEYFTPKHTLYKKETTKTGVISSPAIPNNVSYEKITPTFFYNVKDYRYPLIKGIYIKDLHNMVELPLSIGSAEYVEFPMARINRGVNILEHWTDTTPCHDIQLILAAKDDRLYTSARFIDLDGTFEMGEINLNHWEVYNGKFLDYRCTDSSFELIDYRGYVAFNISYSQVPKPLVTINGYLVGPECVMVINSSARYWRGFNKPDSNWKLKAEKEIYKIPRALTSKCD
jgi:hypothetical protein